MTSLPQESSKRLLSTHGKKSKSTLSAVIPKRLTLYRAIHSYTNARTGKSKTLADAGITFWESELLHDGYRITDQTGTRASRPYTTKIGWDARIRKEQREPHCTIWNGVSQPKGKPFKRNCKSHEHPRRNFPYAGRDTNRPASNFDMVRLGTWRCFATGNE